MLVQTYLNRMKLTNYRPNTIDARWKCLAMFSASLEGRSLMDATRFDIEAFLARPLAPESRRAYRSHLRAFYSWCVEEGVLGLDPSAKIAPIRVPQAMPRPIGRDDLARALDLATARMRAWLLLMSLAGLRACEVSGLRPGDLLDTSAGTLLFLRETKGGGSATVPAHPEVLAALAALPIRNGLWWTCGARSVSREVSLHLSSAGVNATGHQLRHTAGTAWYRASGHDLLATATLLRHKNVQTSRVYAQLDPTRPAEVVNLVTLPELENAS